MCSPSDMGGLGSLGPHLECGCSWPCVLLGLEAELRGVECALSSEFSCSVVYYKIARGDDWFFSKTRSS